MHFKADFDCMPFMTALKKWKWRVWGLEFKASLSFLESVSSGQGYMVSKTIQNKMRFFNMLCWFPFIFHLQTIWSWFICYMCWVVIQFSVPHCKLSRASLKIHVFSNISHFNEIHLIFAVVPVNCFSYCEDIFQSVKVPFVYFCFGAFVFKSYPKIFQVCQCHGDFPLSIFELFYNFMAYI